MDIPAQKGTFLQLLCSIGALNRLYDVPSHIGEGGSSLLSLQIQNSNLFWTHVHRQTLRSCFKLTWASFSLIKLAYKMNHHIWPTQPLLLCSSKQLFCLINENLCYWILVMILFNLIEYIREHILSFYLDRKTEWWKFWLISLSHMSRKGLTGIERDCLWFQDPYSSQTFYIFIPLTHNIFFSAMLRSLWDLSSLTRYGNWTLGS